VIIPHRFRHAIRTPVAVATGVLLTAALATLSSPVAANAMPLPIPSQPIRVPPMQRAGHRPVLFGGTSPLMSEQSEVGHLGIVRLYYTLGEKFTNKLERQALGEGSTLLVSLDAKPGSGVTYASIIAGHHDHMITGFLTRVEQAAVHYKVHAIYVAFEHEANSPPHRELGTPKQFVAAYNHVHALAARAGLNWNDGGRLHWALILEHIAYFPAPQRPNYTIPQGFSSQFWPGNDVNVVAADGYNHAGCKQSNNSQFLAKGDAVSTPAELFDPVISFAQSHGNLPVIIAEWGSVSYSNPAIRPEFIQDMQRFVLAHPDIKGVSYWDSSGGLPGRGSTLACNMSVNHDQRSLNALAAMNRALQATQ
jgi:hypothetical protein